MSSLADRVCAALKGRPLSFDSLRHELDVSAMALDAALKPLRAARRVLPEGGRLVLAAPSSSPEPAPPLAVGDVVRIDVAPWNGTAVVVASSHEKPVTEKPEPITTAGEPSMPKSKTCTECGETKPLNEYRWAPRAADGRMKVCLDCYSPNGEKPKKAAKPVQTSAPKIATIAEVAARHASRKTPAERTAEGLKIPARRAFTAQRTEGGVALQIGEGREAQRLGLYEDELRALVEWWRGEGSAA